MADGSTPLSKYEFHHMRAMFPIFLVAQAEQESGMAGWVWNAGIRKELMYDDNRDSGTLTGISVGPGASPWKHKRPVSNHNSPARKKQPGGGHFRIALCHWEKQALTCFSGPSQCRGFEKGSPNGKQPRRSVTTGTSIA